MVHAALSMDIEGVSSMMEAAKSAAQAGDMLVAEEALVDAYNRLSKILKDLEANERRLFGTPGAKSSVAIWRNGAS
jgi:hypothetical protein